MSVVERHTEIPMRSVGYEFNKPIASSDLNESQTIIIDSIASYLNGRLDANTAKISIDEFTDNKPGMTVTGIKFLIVDADKNVFLGEINPSMALTYPTGSTSNDIYAYWRSIEVSPGTTVYKNGIRTNSDQSSITESVTPNNIMDPNLNEEVSNRKSVELTFVVVASGETAPSLTDWSAPLKITEITVDITDNSSTIKNIEEPSAGVSEDKVLQIIEKEEVKRDFQISMVGSVPNYYARKNLFVPNKTTIMIPANTQVNINNVGYINNEDVVLNLSDFVQPSNRAGKDIYIYACTPSIDSDEPVFVLSLNSTVPSGYTAETSRKIGGFHCLCVDVGTISGHTLSGYVAGDILPLSVWDLRHRPVANPEGMVWIEQINKWVDIYLASWDGAKLISAYGGTVADGASSRKYHGLRFNEDLGLVNKRLPEFDDFMVFAKGSNEQTNISGSADAGTTGGHKDTANRRMISNYGLEDCCGFMWQWCKDQFDITSTNSNAAYTAGNRYINHNVFADTQTDAKGNTQINTNWHIEPVYEPNVDSDSYGWVYLGLLVRLLAGGNWVDSFGCGSRSAVCYDFGSYVASSIGARGVSEARNYEA